MVLLDVVDNFWGSPALAYLGLSETSYLGNLAYSSSIVITAWGVGAGAGLAIGLLAARVQWVRDLSEPILLVFGAVPVLVAAPFAVIWFGFGPVGQWILVGFFCWATVAVVAMAAALQVPPYFEEYAASLGVPERRRFAHIILPATLPAIGTGLRAALAAAWGLQAVAELMGSEAGVGRVIAVRANTGDVAAVLGLIITLGLVAVIADRLLVALLRKVITWN
jgi:ABC-type nitrate/sulfonate/bicarbonate transport system permease component